MTERTTLSAFRNRHRGEAIVVCGCGRSVRDLEHPEQLVTIGVNDVGRLFDPTYLVVVNPRHQFAPERFRHIETSRCQALFTQLDLRLSNPNVVRFALGQRGGTDLSNPNILHYTGNSPYVAVCLAVQMGASRVGLIGVDFTEDHFFSQSGPHALGARLRKIDREYDRLRSALARNGIELVNLSRQSRLSCLPKLTCAAFRDIAEPGKANPDTVSKPVSPDTCATRTKPPVAERSRPATGRGGFTVVHVAKTNCAGALWNLHELLTAHTTVRSRVVTASTTTGGRSYPRDVLLHEQERVADLLREADLVHFHNRIDPQSPEMRPFRHLLEGKPAVLQFHSEPEALQQHFPGRDLRTRDDMPTLVVAQKHARFYPRAIAVPNAVDITCPALRPGSIRPNGPVRVVYTPTDTADYGDHGDTCRGKGYSRTAETLYRLQDEGRIEAVVATNLAWPALMEMRRNADVVIDECVTGGYHLTSLEGLSQGLATIAFLDPATRRLLRDVTGCADAELPWLSTPLDRLAEALRLLADNPHLLAACRSAGRVWMEKYWAPATVADHYLAAYHTAMAGHPRPHRNLQTSRARPASEQARLPDRSRPRRSEDLPQTVRLGPALTSRRDRLTGRPCHILGNGPSINEVDLTLLGRRTTIGVNASPLLHGALGRATDYYCVADRRFLQDQASCELARSAYGAVRVFAGYCAGFLPDSDIHYVRILGGDGISDDVRQGVYHGFSVVLFAAQVALWLGCTDLYLHGCEFDYRRGRFAKSHDDRPHDTHTYPRVARNVERLAKVLADRGGSLTVVGRSRLVGAFGGQALPGITRMSTAALNAGLSQPRASAAAEPLAELARRSPPATMRVSAPSLWPTAGCRACACGRLPCPDIRE